MFIGSTLLIKLLCARDGGVCLFYGPFSVRWQSPSRVRLNIGQVAKMRQVRLASVMAPSTPVRSIKPVRGFLETAAETPRWRMLRASILAAFVVHLARCSSPNQRVWGHMHGRSVDLRSARESDYGSWTKRFVYCCRIRLSFAVLSVVKERYSHFGRHAAVLHYPRSITS